MKKIIIVLCAIVSYGISSISHKFVLPENCNREEVYDIDNFRCFSCPTSLHTTPSGDRLFCECLKEYEGEIIYNSSIIHPICISSNHDSKNNLKCKLKFVNITETSLSSHSIVIRKTNNFGECECNKQINTQYNELCVYNVLLMPFNLFGTFSQRKIFKDIKMIIFLCKELHNLKACNHLANLCVISIYNTQKNSPCALFLTSQTSKIINYLDSNLNGLRPYLFFNKDSETARNMDKTIDFSYSLKENDEHRNLEFFTVIYALTGNITYIGPLFPQLINICNRNHLMGYKNFTFAKNYKEICKYNLKDISDLAKIDLFNGFFSIYLKYSINGVTRLQAIPILIKNEHFDNEEKFTDSWQFTKRFNLLDYEIREGKNKRNLLDFHPEVTLKYFQSFRALKKFEIKCKITQDNQITIPQIILEYKHTQIYENSSAFDEYQSIFKITFTKQHSFTFWFELLLPLGTALAFTHSLLRGFSFKTRSNLINYDMSVLYEFMLQLFSDIAIIFSGIAVLIAVYSLVSYNSQDHVNFLLPIDEEGIIEVLICVAFILKGLSFAIQLWRIANIDIFFIDWERPKYGDTQSSLQKDNFDKISVCSNARTGNIDSVSVWRHFFIANEWLKLATKTKTSQLIQCVSTLAILKIFEKFALLNFMEDKILNLALIFLIYIHIYCFQILIDFIFQISFGDTFQHFLDICSTANISLFILLKDCYGFYIHGRSPHGFSDTDMSSMLLQLQREAFNMNNTRGLLTGSDRQTYFILPPTELKNYYRKLLKPVKKAVSISQTHFENELNSKKRFENHYPHEKISIFHANLNRFFCAFIDHAIRDLDYTIKERTVIEKLLDTEFDSYLSEAKGTFYVDNNNSFSQVMLLGNSTQIFILETLLLLTIFIITNNILISIFFVACFDKMLCEIFHYLIKSNIIVKTSIDERFLI